MEKRYIEKFFDNMEQQKEYDVFNISLPITLIYKNNYNKNEQMFKQKYNLIHSDVDVLASLYFNGKELSPTELYSAIIFSSGGMTKVLKKLESLKYISRKENPNDKRSMLVKLEKSGEEILLNCLDDLIELKKETYNALTKKEREDLKRILKKITLSLS
ncbi:MarR family winged helix-turn-helix transcriptional regulator [Halarcobacter bivalviorum]|uniref:HTH-type transcriptional regulator SarZ n=1 Tax=Halarcobacter bivalviorum TaxID=663364 RepID=A0AAX2A8E4_9BACT|nr:MarR family transcriptional regulator [Halarcobacter bivalviorum]AXH11065.1 transcriptional regulator, MarR family [Halarcobacter bivalviorum]RXK09745.1 MarR family transcriptional regulator [Halarcobacter bivalviorum]